MWNRNLVKGHGLHLMDKRQALQQKIKNIFGVLQKQKISIAPDVQFDTKSTIVFDQECFLANTCNKQRFIHALAEHLRHCNLNIRQADGDADTDNAAVAINLSEQGKPVVVHAEEHTGTSCVPLEKFNDTCVLQI
jgi:hypothetical protein